MPHFDTIHLPRVKSSAKKVGEDQPKVDDGDQAIPVTVSKSQPHSSVAHSDDYEALYPLHAAKIGKGSKNKSLYFAATGIIILVIILLLTIWYLLAKQNNSLSALDQKIEASSNSATQIANNQTSNQASSAAETSPLKKLPAINISSENTNTDSSEYQNAEYGFSLTLPASWSGVQENEIFPSLDSAKTKPLSTVEFDDNSDGQLVVMRLRIDSRDTYNQWAAELKSNGLSLPSAAKQAGNYFISVEYQADSTGVKTQAQKDIITSISTVFNSFKVTD